MMEVFLCCCLIIRIEDFELIEGKFFIKEKILVKQTPQHNFFRCILWLTKKSETHQSEIIIMNDNNKYTDAFNDFIKRLLLVFMSVCG